MKILAFGEILWDVYPDKQYIGGAPLNFAAHLSKHNEEVYMLSAVGEDELGEKALKQLNKWNIKADYVSVLKDRRTGQCLVTLNAVQVPSYNLLCDVAYDYINSKTIKDSFDVLYFGTLALRSEYNLKSLKGLIEIEKFREVFVDVNIRPPFYTADTLKFAVGKATILKISLEELPIVADLLEINACGDYRNFAKILKNKFTDLNCIIITLGADGAYAFECETEKESFCECAKVEVKSTVGAGDSFSAAFLHKYLSGVDLALCTEYASAVAGFVVSNFDAVPEYIPSELNKN